MAFSRSRSAGWTRSSSHRYPDMPGFRSGGHGHQPGTAWHHYWPNGPRRGLLRTQGYRRSRGPAPRADDIGDSGRLVEGEALAMSRESQVEDAVLAPSPLHPRAGDSVPMDNGGRYHDLKPAWGVPGREEWAA
ncbi:hypothetical protein NKH18_16110 [Streptomyces sp. M10(2022)]